MNGESAPPHLGDFHHVPGNVVVYASKARALLWTGMSFMFVMLGSVFTIEPFAGQDASTTRSIVFALTLLVFGGATVRGIAVLISSRPSVVVSHEGIALAPKPSRSGLIRWAEIKELRTSRSRVQGLLEIVVNDHDALPRLRSQLGLLSRVGFILTGVITLGDAQLAVSVPDLVAEVQARFHIELAHHGISVTALRHS